MVCPSIFSQILFGPLSRPCNQPSGIPCLRSCARPECFQTIFCRTGRPNAKCAAQSSCEEDCHEFTLDDGTQCWGNRENKQCAIKPKPDSLIGVLPLVDRYLRWCTLDKQWKQLLSEGFSDRGIWQTGGLGKLMQSDIEVWLCYRGHLSDTAILVLSVCINTFLTSTGLTVITMSHQIIYARNRAITCAGYIKRRRKSGFPGPGTASSSSTRSKVR